MYLFFRLTCEREVSVLYRELCTLYVSKPKRNKCCDVKIILKNSIQKSSTSCQPPVNTISQTSNVHLCSLFSKQHDYM